MQKNTLIKNKIHLRYEIKGIEEFDQCVELVELGYVDLFSFMDHTPSSLLLNGGDRLTAFANRRKLNEEQARAYIQGELEKPKITKEKMLDLIRLLKSKNISIASHDDDTVKLVEENYAAGMNLCEFPINIETAQRATELGMWVIGGAANVLRGGSNIGNLSVEEAIAKGVINILCSDYYPPSILHSIFKLFDKNTITLPEAVNLASLHPAKAANISQFTGSIEIGKEADLLVVDYSKKFPTVMHTIVKGNVSGEFKLKKSKKYEYSV